MFKSLFGSSHPTRNWQRSADLKLTIELVPASLNGVIFGRRNDLLMALGPSQSKHKNVAEYFDLGLCVDMDDGESFLSFTIYFRDTEYKPYAGELLFQSEMLKPSLRNRNDFIRLAGQPYWEDIDEQENLLFYEYPNLELQIGCGKDGMFNEIVVTSIPLMAIEEQRKSFNVTKSWPPESF